MWLPLDRFSWKPSILKNLSKSSFIKLTRITGTLHEDQFMYLIISCSVLRMRNFSGKSCRENQNTHFMFSNYFFFQKSCYSWDIVEKYDRARQATGVSIIQCIHFACCITKARIHTHTHTHTHTQCLIHIYALPWQHWLHTHATVLCYIYIACLVVMVV